MSMKPRLAVVLVNWNRAEDTAACLRSLWACDYAAEINPGSPALDILVVDNGSRPESVAALKRLDGPFTLIEVGANLGFTGGNNIGMARAMERGADYILLLNNDTVARADALTHLVDTAEADQGIGLAVPKILWMDRPDRIWFGGSSLNRRFLAVRMLGYGEMDAGQYDQGGDVPFVTGCAMLIRRETAERIGGLDERFFAVSEDVDYSLRVAKSGQRMVYIPRAVICHKEAASSGGQDSPGYVYYQVRNGLLLRRLHTDGWRNAAAAFAYWLAATGKRGAAFMLHGQWGSLAGLLAGAWDGLLGRVGSRHV
jgi:GT2 family glycosyltransferase